MFFQKLEINYNHNLRQLEKHSHLIVMNNNKQLKINNNNLIKLKKKTIINLMNLNN